MDDGTSPEDLLFLERATRIGAVALAGRRRWPHRPRCEGQRLALDERAHLHHAHGQRRRSIRHAARRRRPRRIPGRHQRRLQRARRRLGHLRVLAADQGLGSSPRHPLRFRDRPEIRVDSVRLIDTGSIDAEHASVYGVEFGGNWKSLYLQGEHFWFDVERARRRRCRIRTSRVTTCREAGSSPANAGATTRPRAHSRIRGPWCRSPATAASAPWELAARYSRMNLNFMEGIEGTAAAPGRAWRRPGRRDARRQLVPEPQREGDARLPDDRRGAVQSRRSRQHQPFGPRPTRHRSASRSARTSTCSRCERSSVF